MRWKQYFYFSHSIFSLSMSLMSFDRLVCRFLCQMFIYKKKHSYSTKFMSVVSPLRSCPAIAFCVSYFHYFAYFVDARLLTVLTDVCGHRCHRCVCESVGPNGKMLKKVFVVFVVLGSLEI